MKTLDCLECGEPHEEGTSLNGYCEKCVDAFIRREEAKLKIELKDIDWDKI